MDLIAYVLQASSRHITTELRKLMFSRGPAINGSAMQGCRGTYTGRGPCGPQSAQQTCTLAVSVTCRVARTLQQVWPSVLQVAIIVMHVGRYAITSEELSTMVAVQALLLWVSEPS